jgi:6-pyruvoyltetrahydropterin/6-carboxytetrahydropterin synthase
MPHGHNWKIKVHCISNELNKNGMVIDFNDIKKKIHDKLDHNVINNVLPHINPTAENIAEWIHNQINECWRVEVEESEGNLAIYENTELYFNVKSRGWNKKDTK